jgi:putative addiction module component (TIGR02574 family)
VKSPFFCDRNSVKINGAINAQWEIRMSEIAERMKLEFAQLPRSDRAELAMVLLQSLDGEITDQNEDGLKEELHRRAEEIRKGQDVGESAAKVLSDLKADLE